MLIARVIGEVWATQKAASHEGQKILYVQPLDPAGKEKGGPLLALDSVGAGVGDRVLVAQEGFSAMTSVGRKNAPISTSVIGVIDTVELDPGMV